LRVKYFLGLWAFLYHLHDNKIKLKYGLKH
jgi:hypothetical protein